MDPRRDADKIVFIHAILTLVLVVFMFRVIYIVPRVAVHGLTLEEAPRSTISTKKFRAETARSFLPRFITVPCQHKNITHEGAITVSDDKTFTIEDCIFTQTGIITVEDNATLTIRNARLILAGLPITINYRELMIVKNQANLILRNATLIFEDPFPGTREVIIRDDAAAYVLDSSLIYSGIGYVFAQNNSMVSVSHSIMKMVGGNVLDHYFSLLTKGSSIAYVEDSTIDQVGVIDESNVTIVGSVIDTVHGGSDCAFQIKSSTIRYLNFLDGNATNHLYDSTVNHIVTDGHTRLWLTNTSVHSIWAQENSTVWLISSSAEIIRTQQEAIVFIGWDLPIFGIVAVPYTLVPIIQVAAFITTVAAAIVALYVVKKKLQKRCAMRPSSIGNDFQQFRLQAL